MTALHARVEVAAPALAGADLRKLKVSDQEGTGRVYLLDRKNNIVAVMAPMQLRKKGEDR